MFLKVIFSQIALDKLKRRWWKHWRRFAVLSLVILLFIVSLPWAKAEDFFPPAKVHPLPLFLAAWQGEEGIDDYFSQISPSPLGYLIWSRFPLKVYLQKPSTAADNSASLLRFQGWVEAMESGIEEWSKYLPISGVENQEMADIVIERSFPPLETKINPETGLLDLPRARAAQTRYRFYVSSDDPPLLLHQMTIQISPNLSQEAALAAIRHEFGHAFGIWGHSELKTDVLYFSQVRNPPSISVRDINTLKKIYQQPTKLGWEMLN